MTASRPTGNGRGRSPVAEALDRQFALYRADTPELREMCFRLRYEIYCVDNPFEPSAYQLDGLERDWLDAYADHALVVHRPTGLAVGTVRLILPARLSPPAELPFQKICGYRDPISQGLVPLHTAAEVSRFGVPRRARRLSREVSGAAAGTDGEPRTHEDLAIGLPILMLIRGFLMLASGHGIGHLSAMMEPSLLRHVARFGIFFDPVGPPVDHHGIRQPSFVAISEMLGRVDALRPDVWEAITAHGSLACAELPMIAAE